MSEGTSPHLSAQPDCSHLREVQSRLSAALARAGRPLSSARLIAVSKTVSSDRVREAFVCGQRAFGESYVQEASVKQEALADLPIEWHFIGPLQSNKTRPVAERFAWVHGIDRARIAERLGAQRPAGMEPLNVCLQVNIDREASKSGVLPEDVDALAHAVAVLPGLRLRGLMAIPRPTDDPTAQRDSFRRVHELFEALRARGLPLDTLSMGMSGDLEAAIMEGATLVRVGTSLFGARPKS
ncbi:MAG: YggS family pyridoxal phosphate-dependent enzyme [Pseudomonadota bacterium]